MWGNVVQTFQPVFDFDRLTLSGLPRIPVTSLTGMLKNEVSFLSWLIVIWVAFVAGNKQKKDETHRELRLQLRFVETGESLASICWLKMGCRQEVIHSGLVLQNILLAISQFFSPNGLFLQETLGLRPYKKRYRIPQDPWSGCTQTSA